MLSHHHTRAFKPEKLHPPRGFVRPEFKPSQRLVIEIGAGKGKHALTFAAKHPESQIIAIERTKAKFEAFERLACDAKLDNLIPVHADAIAWIIHALGPAMIDEVYLLYPNPEPKNPNQQWLNMPFFEFLLSRIKTDGKVILASNIEAYIDTAYHNAVEIWQLPSKRQEVDNDSRRTHFEIKYLARGERCWQLTIKKPSGYQTRFDDWQAKSEPPLLSSP